MKEVRMGCWRRQSFVMAGVANLFAIGSVSALPVTIDIHATGLKEVDASGASVGDLDAKAEGFFTFDPEANTIFWHLMYEKIDGSALSAAHIHGPAGANTTAPPFIDMPLSTTATPNGMLMSTNTAPHDKNMAILAQPHLHYVKRHSTGTGGLPRGAVRGRLPEPSA